MAPGINDLLKFTEVISMYISMMPPPRPSRGQIASFHQGGLRYTVKQAITAWFNDVRVRKYADPEPTVSLVPPPP